MREDLIYGDCIEEMNKLIDENIINKAVVRIIAWKYSYDII